jgi:hypothetical protein
LFFPLFFPSSCSSLHRKTKQAFYVQNIVSAGIRVFGVTTQRKCFVCISGVS